MNIKEIESRVMEGGFDQLPKTDPKQVMGLPRHVPLRTALKELLQLLSYSLEYWPSMLLSTALMIIFSLLSSVGVLMFAPLISLILNPSTVPSQAASAAPAPLSSSTFNLNSFGTHALVFFQTRLHSPTPTRLMMALCVVLVLIVVLRSVCGYLGKWIAWDVQIKTFYKLQRNVFENVLSQDMRFFHRHRVGSLISEIQTNVAAIVSPIQEVISVLLGQPLLLICYFVLMLKTSRALTLITLITTLLTGLIAQQVGGFLRHIKRSQLSQTSLITALMQEALYGIRVVKAFAAEVFESERYAGKSMDYLMLEKQHMAAKLAVEPANAILGIVCLSVILVWGATFVLHGQMSFTGLLMFLFVTQQSMSPLNAIGNTISTLFSVLGASERVFELLKEKPAVVGGMLMPPPLKENLALKQVTFDYGNGPVLKTIDLTLKAGETVAVVGPSGGGKSTLIDLFLRFYDPTSGTIELDGIDIRRFNLAAYRRLFGIVPQETILFNDTVRNNIAYGRASVRDEDIMAAAKIAQAHDFVIELPKGYDTFIGDRGTRLSGGERQRLAIARAVLSKPAILVFDEATSSLDNKSEQVVQAAIDRVIQGRTTILIAHRLSTVRRADRIIVINDGRIVEEGTHDALMGISQGLYQKLFQLQFQENVLPASIPEEAS